MSNLECSSKGDKRFSAFYAKVTVNGKLNSIENHYQNCKLTNDLVSCMKGQKVDLIYINGKKLNPKFLTPFYKLLWVKYLDQNPDLVAYAKQFDTFSDMFRGKSINCQADVIKEYVKLGRKHIMQSEDVLEFQKIMINGGNK